MCVSGITCSALCYSVPVTDTQGSFWLQEGKLAEILAVSQKTRKSGRHINTYWTHNCLSSNVSARCHQIKSTLNQFATKTMIKSITCKLCS